MSNNPFDPLQSRVDRFLNHDLRAQQWESSRVEWLAKKLGIAAEIKELRRGSAFADRVLLHEFNEWFSMFPMQFVAEALIGEKPLDADLQYAHPKWFQSFLDLPIVRLYERHFVAWQAGDDKRPLGMIFPRLGFQQGLVIHNGGFGFVPAHGSAHVFNPGRGAEWYCVQPFSQLIDHIHATRAWR